MDENSILGLLEKIYTEVKETKAEVKDHTNRLDRIEKKLDSTISQTADLTEFRTETGMNFDRVSKEIKDEFNELRATNTLEPSPKNFARCKLHLIYHNILSFKFTFTFFGSFETTTE